MRKTKTKQTSRWTHKFSTSFKKIIKELKRVHWPNGKEMKESYFKIILFIVIGSLILFGLAILFQTIWSELGVGINE